MNLILRQTDINDIPEIVEIFSRTYSKAPWNEQWDDAVLLERITDFVGCNIALNYCACDEHDTIISVLFGRRNYFLNAKELFVDEFFVDDSFQHRGIGTFVIEEVAKRIKALGYKCMILNTEQNYPSEKFYLKNGFIRKESNIFMYKLI